MHNVKPVKIPETKDTWWSRFLDNHHDFREFLWKLEDVWDKITFYHFRRRLKFAYEYGRFAFKHQYDFDYSYIWNLLEFKLTRARESMRNTVLDSEHTRALELAIKLCNRLYNHDYGARLDKKFRDKWGDGKLDTTPTEDGYFSVEFIYKDMDEDSIEARGKELTVNYDLENGLRQRDAKWLFDIMNKYIWGWWD